MLISIVTPVLNGAKTIDRTLKALSVQKADFEHIVMDGGSKDATEEIVRGYEGRYPVQWHTKPDRSIYDGLWNGTLRTSGDIMGMINADDFYLPWTLAIVQRVFTEHPDVDWVTGIPSWYFEDSGLQFTSGIAPVYLRSFIQKGWYTSNRLGFLQQESMFWRRSLWEKEKSEIERMVGQYRLGMDYHMWKLFARHAELRTVSSVLACFTISSGQATAQQGAKYLSECGLRGESFDVNPMWKAFNRFVSFALFRRVIRPCPLRR